MDDDLAAAAHPFGRPFRGQPDQALGEDPAVWAGDLDGVSGSERARDVGHPRRQQGATALGSSGSLTVDDGAQTALTELGRSLLAAGVTGVSGTFSPEDAVEIAGPDGRVFAKGLVRQAAERASQWMGGRSTVVVHRDDLVLVT